MSALANSLNLITAKSLAISVADAEKVPFADAAFDKVICSEVLEHINDYQRVMSNTVSRNRRHCSNQGSIFPERICWKLSMLIMRSREAMSEFSSQENCVKTSKQKVLSALQTSCAFTA